MLLFKLSHNLTWTIIHSAYEEGQEDLEEDMTSITDVENIAALLKLPSCFSASDDDSEDSDSDCYTNSDLELLE